MSEIKFQILEAKNDRVILELKQDSVAGDTITLKSQCTAFDNVNQWGRQAIDQAVKQAQQEWERGEEQKLLTDYETNMKIWELQKNKEHNQVLQDNKTVFEIEKKALNNEILEAKATSAKAVSDFITSDEYKREQIKHNTTAAELKYQTENMKSNIESQVNFQTNTLLLEEQPKLWKKAKEDYATQINEKDRELENLKLKVSQLQATVDNQTTLRSGQSKNSGQELENECYENLSESFSAIEEVRVKFITGSAEDEKADLLVQVCFDENWESPFKTITIECKAKADDSKTKIKNKKCIQKLIENSQGSDLAILATRLEPDVEMTIQPFYDSDFKNSLENIDVMFCRPWFLVALVKIYFVYCKKLWKDKQSSLSMDNAQSLSIDFNLHFEKFYNDTSIKIDAIIKSFVAITQHQDHIIKKAKETQELINGEIKNRLDEVVGSFSGITAKKLEDKYRSIHKPDMSVVEAKIIDKNEQ